MIQLMCLGDHLNQNFSDRAALEFPRQEQEKEQSSTYPLGTIWTHGTVLIRSMVSLEYGIVGDGD